jgi:hypothetical protein
MKRLANSIGILGIGLSLVLLLSACDSNITASAQAYAKADALDEAVDEFEKSRTTTSKQFSDTTQDTIDKLKFADPNLRQITREWERKWNTVKVQYDSL